MDNNNTDADHLQRDVCQLVDGLFDDFIEAELVVERQNEFELIINKLIYEIFEGFKSKYERIKNHQKFKNIFLGVVRSKQMDLFNSENYITVAADVRNINDDSDIDQPFFEAILIYCKRSDRDDRRDVINYPIMLETLLQVFHKINNHRLGSLNEVKIYSNLPDNTNPDPEGH
jgi:hypothetical protein